MRLTITTWNINSVRLRIDSVARFVKAVRPDRDCVHARIVQGEALVVGHEPLRVARDLD